MRFLGAAGLVMILSGLGAYYAVGELSPFSSANLVLGPVLVVAAAVAQSRGLRGFSGALARRVVVRWTAVCTAVVALALGANALVSSWTASVDLTPERQYTLSDQSEQLCEQLDAAPEQPALELLLFEEAKLAQDVRLLVAAYRAACPIETRELETADAPLEARAILESYETTVVTCRGGRCEYVGYPSEENITNALLRLVRASSPRVYFTIGHGEADLASEAEHGFSSLTGALRSEGVELAAFVGPAHEEVPADADVLIAAAPARNFLPGEIEAVERYLTRGGRLLVLLEPDLDSNLADLLEGWGFELPEGVVADRQSSPLLEEPTPVSLVVNGFSASHDITRKMSVRTMTLMPSARAVFPARKPQPEDQLAGLAFSSRRAWIEHDVGSALAGRPVTPGPDELSGRELPLAAAGRYPRGDAGTEARIVVIGDGDFASNRWIRSLYNRDLILNAVLWLAEEEEHVAIRPKGWTPATHPLTLETSLAYFYFLAFALPEVLLLLGIHAWYRQRG